MSLPKACKDCKYSQGSSYYPTCMHKSAKLEYYSLTMGQMSTQGSAEMNRNCSSFDSCGGNAKHYQPSFYRRLCELFSNTLTSRKQI